MGADMSHQKSGGTTCEVEVPRLAPRKPCFEDEEPELDSRRGHRRQIDRGRLLP